MALWKLFAATLPVIPIEAAAVAGCDSGSPQGELGVWTPGATPSGASGSNAPPTSSADTLPSSGSGEPAVANAPGGIAVVGGSSGSGGGSSSGVGTSLDTTASGSSSGGGGSSSSSGGAAAPAPYVWDGGTGTLPCDVASMLAASCTSCHSDPPINNSLAGLVTFADLVARAKEDPTKNEAELSLARMKNAASPMPPAALMMPPTAAQIAVLQNWINAGFPSGTACAADAGAGSLAGTVASNVFAGQAAFALGTEINGHHNPGQDCQSHHHNGEFSIAGTVYDGTGKALAGAEIRVVDAKGTVTSMYSGTNGNFYSKGGATLALGAHTGARNAASTALMISQASGACNSCHTTGGVAPQIHLP